MPSVSPFVKEVLEIPTVLTITNVILFYFEAKARSKLSEDMKKEYEKDRAKLQQVQIHTRLSSVVPFWKWQNMKTRGCTRTCSEINTGRFRNKLCYTSIHIYFDMMFLNNPVCWWSCKQDSCVVISTRQYLLFF